MKYCNGGFTAHLNPQKDRQQTCQQSRLLNVREGSRNPATSKIELKCGFPSLLKLQYFDHSFLKAKPITGVFPINLNESMTFHKLNKLSLSC